MLSHINDQNQPQMVNVGGKPVTQRFAVARAVVELPDVIARAFAAGDLVTKKGPVVHTAIIAGVMAAKKTSDLIPFCHPIGMDDCKIEITISGNELTIQCTAAVQAKTGVEMEALTGVSVAALTVYDMCKAMSHGISIRDIRLVSKTGGTSDYEL